MTMPVIRKPQTKGSIVVAKNAVCPALLPAVQRFIARIYFTGLPPPARSIHIETPIGVRDLHRLDVRFNNARSYTV